MIASMFAGSRTTFAMRVFSTGRRPAWHVRQAAEPALWLAPGACASMMTTRQERQPGQKNGDCSTHDPTADLSFNRAAEAARRKFLRVLCDLCV